MRTIVFSILIITVAAIAAQGQKPKPLPDSIATYQDSSELLSDQTVRIRLQAVTGKKGFETFMESFETVTPIIKSGDWIFASGCLIHACTHLESAIAIDLRNNAIHAAVFREEKRTRFFNERRRKTPALIADWAKRLRELQPENTTNTRFESR